MKKIIYQCMAGLIAIAGVVALFGTGSVLALDPLKAGCDNAPSSEFCQQTKNAKQTVPTLVQNIVTTLLYVLGVISVIMIIVGGIQYALGGGDSNQLTRAKNTILYAIIGLVVALLSYGIIYFILNAFS